MYQWFYPADTSRKVRLLPVVALSIESAILLLKRQANYFNQLLDHAGKVVWSRS